MWRGAGVPVVGLSLSLLFAVCGAEVASAQQPAVSPPQHSLFAGADVIPTARNTVEATPPSPVDHSMGRVRAHETRTASLQAARTPETEPDPTAPAPATQASIWWMVTLGLGVGGGVVGLLYWYRARSKQRRLKANVAELRNNRQELEQALQEAAERVDKLQGMSDAKSVFLKELSHAFRTPLTLTLGPVDNLLEGKHGSLNEDARTQLRLAQRNGTRLLWLVNQLLDLAELETDSMALEPTKGDFVQFVANSTWAFEGLAERRDIRLGVEASLEHPILWFDEAKMEKILANLLTGAFRSVDQGGAIRVRVHPADGTGAEDDGVELVVADASTGFPSRNGNGSSTDRSTSSDDPLGTGDVNTSVGLYLVEELVDLHGGHVRMEGQVGNGVRFLVRLPRKPEGTEAADEAPGGDSIPRTLKGETPDALTLSRKALSLELRRGGSASAPSPSEGDVSPNEEDKTTVLVIDDNPVVRTLVCSHLEPTYRVKEAEEGAAGYNLARAHLPDLVIADVMMPEMDGFELCRKIKQDPDIDHIPVIFLTARADLEDKIEGLDVGADAYLTKPFEPEELIAHVENLIETRRSLRESFREERADRDPTDGSSDAAMSARGAKTAEEALPPSAGDESLREQIEETIADNLTDPDFGVSELAASTALSPSQLRRRMKELYDRTPVQLIRRRRLEAGAQLLREKPDATIGEVAYAVGFNSQSYFSRSFRKEFGSSPSQYREQPEGIEA